MNADELQSNWQDLREGLSYVARWPGLLGLILLAMMLNFLLSPVSALTPLVVKDVFRKGAGELGWTRAFFGGGTIIAGVILSAWGGSRRRIVTSLAASLRLAWGSSCLGWHLPICSPFFSWPASYKARPWSLPTVRCRRFFNRRLPRTFKGGYSP